jgi:alkylation response protein AidB-like acyl-CoA dehydrogenase
MFYSAWRAKSPRVSMDLGFSDKDAAFRAEVRAWLDANLRGEFEELRGRGGPGDEHALFELRQTWEQRMAAAGFTCLGWPREHGGRAASLTEQVVFHEEYARAGGPGRLGHIGEELVGPTLISFASEALASRFLPGIREARTLWCQGYSEPNAGSDLANVQTRAVRDGDDWVIHGQKIWTSLAHWAEWCFVLCRTEAGSARHKGLSYLLVPMRQPGVEVRPIVQLTKTSEFNEVFFDGARTPVENVVGEAGEGWKVAMATLAFERGVSTLGQQLSFQNELDLLIAAAKANGKNRDPVMRQRLARAAMELEIMRLNALRTLSGAERGQLGREALISKLFWSTWHKELGNLAMNVLGLEGQLLAGEPYELGPFQRLFLFSRADTIYAGSSEIQKNIIAERGLGLPAEPRPRAPNS